MGHDQMEGRERTQAAFSLLMQSLPGSRRAELIITVNLGDRMLKHGSNVGISVRDLLSPFEQEERDAFKRG